MPKIFVRLLSIISIILLPSFVTKAGEIEDLNNKLKYLNEKMIIESKISTAVAQSVGYGSIEEFRNWAKSDNKELKKQLDQYKNQLDLLKNKYGRHVSENDKGGENTKTTDSSLTSTQENTSDTQVKAKREKSPPPKVDKVNRAEKVQIGGTGFPSGSIEDEDIVKLLLGNTLFYSSRRSGKSTRYIQNGGKSTFCNSNKKKCSDDDKVSKWKSDNRFCLKEPFVNRGSWWCIINAKYDDKSGTLKGNGTGTGAYFTWKIYRGNYKPV